MKLGGVLWGRAARPIQGERECGDLEVVAAFDGGVLLAVIDGLGHGHEAAAVSAAAARVLIADPGLSPAKLVERCHEALRGSRGVALLVVSLFTRAGQCRWTGVGNVEGVRYHRRPAFTSGRDALISTPGVVGYRMPTLRERQIDLAVNDVVVMATDGVSPRFTEDAVVDGTPDALASEILLRYGRASDDALVLVARYHGAGAESSEQPGEGEVG